MKNTELIVDFIKRTSSMLYGKEVFFYDEKSDKWYSREHGDYVELETVIEWLEGELIPLISESQKLTDSSV